MNINKFLIEAHKALNAATIENKVGELAQCMYQLGILHGLLHRLTEQNALEPSQSTEPKKS